MEEIWWLRFEYGIPHKLSSQQNHHLAVTAYKLHLCIILAKYNHAIKLLFAISTIKKWM